MRSYVFLLLMVLIASCSPQMHQVSILTDSGKVSFQVDIADTPESREKGLMNVAYMPENKGMLFVFEDEDIRYFWMKDTLIPLDMIFIDAEGKIVHIEHDARVKTSETVYLPDDVVVEGYKIYSSVVPAKYVLELNAGVAEKKGIHAGQKITKNW